MINKEKLEVIDVNFLKEGTLLSGILYDEQGNMLWPARKPITNSFILKLKEKNIKNVYYSPPKYKELTYQQQMFSKTTQELAKNAIEEILTQVRFGKKPDIKAARHTIENLFQEMLSNSEKFLNLMILKDYDSYTYYHSINVGILSMYLTKKLGFNDLFVLDVGLGGFLHDIGKMHVPGEIVNKNGILTFEEFEEMKKHPIYGFNIIKNDSSISNYVKKIVLYHHEKWDGSGYPLHLKEESIGNFTGIVSVSDVYDALTTERPYKKAYSVNDALLYIMRNTLAYFNPYVSQRFVNEMAKMYDLGSFYPVGSFVKLNTGEIGYVRAKDKEYSMRPELILIRNFQGVPFRNPIISDLRLDTSRYIYKTIDEPDEIEELGNLLKS